MLITCDCYSASYLYQYLTLAPEDYTGEVLLLTFTPSMLANGVPVTIINDNIVESNETFYVVLDPHGQPVITRPDTATLLITEDPSDREY